MVRKDICERCQQIPAKIYQPVDEATWSRVAKHSGSYSQLVQSATTCPLCKVCLKYIDDWFDSTYYASKASLLKEDPVIVLKNMYDGGQGPQRQVWLGITEKKWE
ncbi:Uu.00g135680.m01.CDS01 [Anthostomella pinea]|uniref:Uu.00g135680.m01.CDS01 n=1 Tax=Anthostomella pinea TaxID=933095 RepID=A0AAI8VP62_9PEZI|nr:Uu.00g135680.m01.CDS01 [Anthostomella pinea]